MNSPKKRLIFALIALWLLWAIRPIVYGLLHQRVLFHPSALAEASTWSAVLTYEAPFLVSSIAMALAVTVIALRPGKRPDKKTD
jgi:hypothetical protein